MRRGDAMRGVEQKKKKRSNKLKPNKTLKSNETITALFSDLFQCNTCNLVRKKEGSKMIKKKTKWAERRVKKMKNKKKEQQRKNQQHLEVRIVEQ